MFTQFPFQIHCNADNRYYQRNEDDPCHIPRYIQPAHHQQAEHIRDDSQQNRYITFLAHSFVQETGEEQVLQFECTAINIGTLSEDDAPVTYHFKYCNVSKKTVRISKLTTSCGCTVAKCNKDLVQPGERGEINLVFHPKDQAGDLYREKECKWKDSFVSIQESNL